MRATRWMLVAVAMLAAGSAREVCAQETRTRFEIVAPNDTTFTIILAGAKWVKTGMRGIVVDPRQRDEMIARFSVAKIDERTARATVTGMTASISEFHMALLPTPKKKWFRSTVFWIGAGLGLAAGFFIGRG